MSGLLKISLISSIATSITCFMFPDIISLGLKTVVSIILMILINKTGNWFRWKYHDYSRANAIFSIFETLSGICLLGYANQQLTILSKTHGGLIGFIHSIANTMYELSISITYYSLLIGSIGSLSLLILRPILCLKLQSYESFLINAISMIPNQQNIDISYQGINLIRSGLNVLDQNTLNTRCPLRCPGLGNNKRDIAIEYSKPETCSICTESYSEKQLTRTLPCNHSFHAPCIDPWLLQSSSVCPICRKDVKSANIGS